MWSNFAQLKQTKQINHSVSKLASSIKDQERLLEKSNAINVAVLDASLRQLEETKRQTNFMEYEVKKRITSDLAKEAIFQFNQHLKYINLLNSNLEKYILSKNCFMHVEKKGIKFENLSDIQDKEYFAAALENLNKIADESIKNLSTDELNDLNNISSFSENIKQLDEMKIQAKLSNDKIIEIKNKNSKDLEQFITKGASTKKAYFVTFGRVFLLLLLGIGLSFIFSANKIAGALVISTSAILFVYILIRNVFFLIRNGVSKEKKEEKRLSDENIRAELIKKIQEDFKDLYDDISSSLYINVDLGNYEDVLGQKKYNLDQLYSDTIKKYPAIDASII